MDTRGHGGPLAPGRPSAAGTRVVPTLILPTNNIPAILDWWPVEMVAEAAVRSFSARRCAGRAIHADVLLREEQGSRAGLPWHE